MKKSILKIKGFQELSKENQKSINGGWDTTGCTYRGDGPLEACDGRVVVRPEGWYCCKVSAVFL